MRLPAFLAGRRNSAIVVGVLVIGCCAAVPAAAQGSSSSGLKNGGNAWQQGGRGDGLNRFVVSLASAVSPSTNGQSPTATTTPASTPQSTGGTDHLDLALLAHARAALGEGGSLDIDAQGRTVYVVGNRSMPVGVGAVQGNAPATADPAKELQALQEQPGIVSAQRLRDGTVLVATALTKADVEKLPNVAAASFSPSIPVAGAVAVPNDPYFNYDWHLRNTGWAQGQTATAGDDVDALDAWSITQGAGVVVADIDTGMDIHHEDLAASLWTNPNESCGTADTDGDGHAGDCHGWNFYRNNSDLENGGDDAHGTVTAGTIAAQINNGLGVSGLAPQAKIMVLVVGAGEVVDPNAAIQAVYYAVDHGANVINCSFGGGATAATISAWQAAIGYAQAHGVMLAIAAGNDSGNRDASPMYPANISNPAAVTVGASDANDAPASFSAYGKTTVALFAPGVLIATPSNDGGYVLESGTSLSAPLVAATLALEKSADPMATVAQLRARLLNNTTPVAKLAAMSSSGGILNAGAAVGAGPGVLHYRFGSFSAAQPGVAFAAKIGITGSAPAGTPELAVHLLTTYQNSTWAVSQTPITLDGSTLSTDDDGMVTFALTGSDFADGESYQPTLTLPAGTYALVAQIVVNGTPVGRPAAAVFTIGAASSGGGGSTGGSTGNDDTGAGSTGGGSTGTTPTDSGSSSGGADSAGDSTGNSSGGASGSSSAGGSTGGNTSDSTGSTGTHTGDSTGPTGGDGGGSSGSTGGSAGGGTGSTVGSTGTGSAGGSTGGPDTSGSTGGSDTSGSTGGSTGGSGAGSRSGGSTGENNSANQQFAGTDQFQITGLTPTVLTTSGGIEILTGRALPIDIRVLVGGTPAIVFGGNTSTTAVFLAPPMLPGSYDVAVYSQSKTTPTTLAQVLTYIANGTTGGAAGDSSGGSTGGNAGNSNGDTSGGSSGGAAGGGATTGSASTGGATTGDSSGNSTGNFTGGSTDGSTGGSTGDSTGGSTGGNTGGSTGGGSDTGGSTGGSTGGGTGGSTGNGTGSASPSVVITPSGLRLVQSATATTLGATLNWNATACSVGDCDGTPL